MSKHTPGLWEVDAMARDYMNQLIIMGPCPDQGRKVIANGAVDGKGSKASFTDEQAANARLIAAAPELLAALQNLMNATLPGMPADTVWVAAAHDQARVAIAKAQGENQ